MEDRASEVLELLALSTGCGVDVRERGLFPTLAPPFCPRLELDELVRRPLLARGRFSFALVTLPLATEDDSLLCRLFSSFLLDRPLFNRLDLLMTLSISIASSTSQIRICISCKQSSFTYQQEHWIPE